MQIDTRSRARNAMRRELADSAFDYLAERDYDSVTVDELARVLGISRATFFRYFEAKEDVVVDTAAPSEHDFVEVVSALGQADRPRPAEAVFRLLVETLPPIEQQTSRLRARVRMTTTNPALGARLALRRGARQAELADALTDWTTDREEAEICAALSFACLDQAWRSWARDDASGDLRHCYEQIITRAKSLL